MKRDIETTRNFREQLRSRTKSVERTTLTDVDAFVRNLTTRLAKRTVADSCSSLRAFLRFLQITGRLSADLAGAVIAPRYRIDERPPRTLPWTDVQKILHSISRSQAPGKRDFAIMLLLATYGLSAAEVLALRLDDLDWRAGVLRARRPKTNVPIEIPLLPAVAKAIEVHGYELIATERHKKIVVGKLNHTCNLLQRLFIAEVVAFEEDVARTTPADSEIKALPAHTKDELRVQISRVQGNTKEEGTPSQFDEIKPHSYADVLADLRNTINDLLGTASSHSAIPRKN